MRLAVIIIVVVIVIVIIIAMVALSTMVSLRLHGYRLTLILSGLNSLLNALWRRSLNRLAVVLSALRRPWTRLF
jgi:type II secretory pathway pseudopilin PulG